MEHLLAMEHLGGAGRTATDKQTCATKRPCRRNLRRHDDPLLLAPCRSDAMPFDFSAQFGDDDARIFTRAYS